MRGILEVNDFGWSRKFNRVKRFIEFMRVFWVITNWGKDKMVFMMKRNMEDD